MMDQRIWYSFIAKPMLLQRFRVLSETIYNLSKALEHIKIKLQYRVIAKIHELSVIETYMDLLIFCHLAYVGLNVTDVTHISLKLQNWLRYCWKNHINLVKFDISYWVLTLTQPGTTN